MNLRFSKPKTPGFGLSRNFYVTVLAARATLPSIAQVVSPKPVDGVVAGFGVPLASNATQEDLVRPLQRGAFAISSLDRKTVLRCLVLSKEEAGFDPEVLARSAMGATANPELLSRVRATWSLIQLSFESHDPMVKPALKFLVELLHRFGNLTDGVIADPICRRYLLPNDIVPCETQNSIPSALHVSVHSRAETEGIRLYTLGMSKFGLPEFEVAEIQEPDVPCGESFLLSLAQTVLDGRLASHGDKVGDSSMPLQIVEGGLDRGLWEGIPCYELIPANSGTTTDAVRLWVERCKHGHT